MSAVTVAKTYRLLKAIFNTAVDDGLIRRTPCRIKGARQEKSAERPVLTVPQVYAEYKARTASAQGYHYQSVTYATWPAPPRADYSPPSITILREGVAQNVH